MYAYKALVTVVIIIVCIMIATTFTWEVPEVETYFESQPYTFESSVIRESQEKRFLWFCEYTQVQYKIINTDVNKGTFTLNFIFDNGIKTETTKEEVEIIQGEEKVVTVSSPLSGRSSVTVKVIPPNKSIPRQRTVMKTVTVLDYIGLGWIPALFR